MSSAIKIVLTILLLLCLADMPYGYYQLVRFAGLIGFGVLSFQAYEGKQNELAIVFFCLALLFQPFVKIALGRQIWNIVDVVVAVFLVVAIFIDRQKK